MCAGVVSTRTVEVSAVLCASANGTIPNTKHPRSTFTGLPDPNLHICTQYQCVIRRVRGYIVDKESAEILTEMWIFAKHFAASPVSTKGFGKR